MKRTSLIYLGLLSVVISLSWGISPVAAQSAATWSMAASGPQENGLHALSGGDGETQTVVKGGSPCLSLTKNQSTDSTYLYFAVTDTAALPAGKSVYLIVQYFDSRLGGNFNVNYDSDLGSDVPSHYVPADDAVGEWMSGSNRWRTAIFELDRPRFQHEQNLGADFRFFGGDLFVRSVQLATSRPAQWKEIASEPQPSGSNHVKIGPGGNLIIGGFDSFTRASVQKVQNDLQDALPAMKSLGMTSVEIYVHWGFCEIAPGRFDWSIYDRYAAILQKNGLKWTPLVICGSGYSLPDWYYKKAGSQPYICLEHHQESGDDSHWNPVLRQHVSQFLKAFCDRYGKTGIIENILLGISGDFGEAIYPVNGNGITDLAHGHYHMHPGYWAADPYAIADFRRWVMHKYSAPAALQAAWGAKSPTTFEAVQPFLQTDAPNNRAWVDMMDWYQEAMTEYTTFWLQEARKDFPSGGIEICTGGDAAPFTGANFAAQCRAAAAIHGGVRITNENSHYRENFTVTRWIASACRQYGAFFSYEPAGPVNADGVVARIYNATASGAKGLHYYYPNLFDTQAATQSFIRQGALYTQRNPVVEIGVYYPETSVQLRGNNFLPKLRPLRDYFDFGFMADTQIADGGLHGIKALVLVDGNIAEARTWQSIAQWVKGGGILIYPTGMGSLQTVEGVDSPLNTLLAAGANTGQGHVYRFDGAGDSADYYAFATRSLAGSTELSAATRTMLKQDGIEDRVFATVVGPKELLWFNPNQTPSTHKTDHGLLTLAPVTIVDEKL